MSIPKESGKSSKPIAKCRQLSPKEKERLFNLYVVPNLKEIKRLTKYYTGNYQDVEDNYNYCLAQLFNYIGSYNPEQKLMTWIGITVKRACFHETKSVMKNLSIGLISKCAQWKIFISMAPVW